VVSDCGRGDPAILRDLSQLQLGAGPQSPYGYYLQRIMGSTDLHLGDRTRVFVELRSGDIFGRNGGPRPSQDKDTLDVSQAFVGLTVIPGDHKPKLELKLGRQELNYGEGSLLVIRRCITRLGTSTYVYRPTTFSRLFHAPPPTILVGGHEHAGLSRLYSFVRE
jgi:hypothetical protein